jgi:hypothetical protein
LTAISVLSRSFIAAALFLHALVAADRFSLAGTWQFRLDAEKDGRRMNWQNERFQESTIFLPGSTDEAGYGLKTSGPSRGWLSRPVVYEGPAWYQREIVVPSLWRGKRLVLFLERPHWETEVWVDGVSFGTQNSLSTPHVYDLSGALAPGRHTLTICVDNTYKIDVGRNAHSVTEHTQTNWNGIVGRIDLEISDPVWIHSARLYPDAASKVVRVQAVIGNATGQNMPGELVTRIDDGPAQKTSVPISGKEQKVEFTVPLDEHVRLWDEYQGELHQLNIRIEAGRHHDERGIAFGVRQFGARGKQFVVNGRPIFLRGTLECNIFPKTGYPPTDVDSWARLYRIARSYGLNHFRFHSWCPPEAAFVAADQAGFLLHVELPVWNRTLGKDPAVVDFMRAEGHRILATYGNHPSFTMLCLGNELAGDYALMDSLVAEFKQADQRRLYTFSADFERKVPGPSSDYYVAQRSAAGFFRIHDPSREGRFQATQSGTDVDYAALSAPITVPIVAHELGQWVTYPSYDEIAKYTGVLKARNLEAFRQQLAERGMVDQARDFQAASGRFAWLLYKEDIETVLRTPQFGGIQLLQLHDFPGQGEALIGLLDSFWDSKGILSPEQMRGFFSETVPLLRLPKFVWTSEETLSGKLQVAHYGRKELSGAVAEWTVCDTTGKTLASGSLAAARLGLGQVSDLGVINVPLKQVSAATRLDIAVKLAGTNARNSWSAWCYPKGPVAGGIEIARSVDAIARKTLAAGGKVLLVANPGISGKNVRKMRFLPVFWSLSWFPKQPGTMGILCDPEHPALHEFPTEMHSNWQWWELTQDAPALILNDAPLALRPIVQVIDDYHRNDRLGAVFEARAGKGKLLVSSLDIESDLDRRVVARQLRQSLLTYMSSDRFDPETEVDLDWLSRRIKGEE